MLKYLMLNLFHWMVNQLNKEINEKKDEIIKEIETSEIFKKYLLLKETIKNN